MSLVHGTATRDWPGLRSEYAWLPPHAGDDGVTVTRPGQIGVAFSGHRDVVCRAGGRTLSTDIAPGSAIVSGATGIAWLRVGEPTEALEIYPDPALVAAYGPAALEPAISRPDATVLGIASVLRRTHVAGASLTDVAAGTLAHRLAEHLAARYGHRPRPERPGRLAAGTADRVAAYVEDRLGETITLDDLAAVARLSPYHFTRAFRATTGLPPYAFVTARRMDRARSLLRTSARSVDDVAAAVGYANLSHFRRTFRRHHAAAPSQHRPQ